MSKRNKELERLERLRQQQLQARDPLAKQRKIERKVVARRRGSKEKVSFKSMITDVPYRWRGAILGAVLGIVISIVLPNLVEGSWAEWIGLLAVVVLALLGFMFGRAIDLRDELRDLTS